MNLRTVCMLPSPDHIMSYELGLAKPGVLFGISTLVGDY